MTQGGEATAGTQGQARGCLGGSLREVPVGYGATCQGSASQPCRALLDDCGIRCGTCSLWRCLAQPKSRQFDTRGNGGPPSAGTILGGPNSPGRVNALTPLRYERRGNHLPVSHSGHLAFPGILRPEHDGRHTSRRFHASGCFASRLVRGFGSCRISGIRPTPARTVPLAGQPFSADHRTATRVPLFRFAYRSVLPCRCVRGRETTTVHAGVTPRTRQGDAKTRCTTTRP